MADARELYLLDDDTFELAEEEEEDEVEEEVAEEESLNWRQSPLPLGVSRANSSINKSSSRRGESQSPKRQASQEFDAEEVRQYFLQQNQNGMDNQSSLSNQNNIINLSLTDSIRLFYLNHVITVQGKRGSMARAQGDGK